MAGGSYRNLVLSTGGATPRTDASRWAEFDSVLNYDAFPDSDTDSLPAFERAFAAMAERDDRRLFVPPYTFKLGISDNAFVSASALPYGLLIKDQPIHLIGAGYGTVLKKLTVGTQYSVVVIAESRGVTVENLRIDGSETSGGTGGTTVTNGHGMYCEALAATYNREMLLRRLWLHDCAGYGIGLQWGNFVGSRLEDIDIDGSGSDGIDIKYRNSPAQVTHAIFLNNIRVKNFGKTASDAAQAGIDLRGYCIAHGLYVTDFGAFSRAGVRFRGGIAGDNSSGSQRSTVTGIYVERVAGGEATTVGVEINADNCQLIGGTVHGCSRGTLVQVSGAASDVKDVSVVGIQAISCDIGFAESSSAKRTKYTSCRSKDSTTFGFYFAGEEAAFDYCSSQSDAGGHVSIDTTADKTRVGEHNSYSGSAAALVDSGKRTTYSGWRNLDNAGPAINDDFDGWALHPRWHGVKGTDAQAILPAIFTALNGQCRLVTGDDAAGTMAVNGSQLEASLNWRANRGTLVIEGSLFVGTSSNTDTAVFFGFTDQAGALEMPFELGAGDALTSNATDAVGVLFDTAADTDNWWLVGVKADADATKQNAGVAPTAAIYETWRIELTTAGAATFYRNGTLVGTQMANAVTASVLLTPVVAAFSRGAASRAIGVDYIMLRQKR